jgi:hypothetical protein
MTVGVREIRTGGENFDDNVQDTRKTKYPKVNEIVRIIISYVGKSNVFNESEFNKEEQHRCEVIRWPADQLNGTPSRQEKKCNAISLTCALLGPARFCTLRCNQIPRVWSLEL